jgi:arylformamidase
MRQLKTVFIINDCLLNQTVLKIIDLTTSYSQAIAGFSSEVAKTVQQNGWNASNLHIYSHAGTHIDAPYHFAVTEERIDEIPVERFISNAHVVSIEIKQSQQLITVSDFATIEHKIKHGESVIIKTGWSNFSGTEKYRKELPRISEETAQWLVSKKVNMLAVEPPSVADVNNLPEVTLIHQILLGGNIIIVEGICNTVALTKTEIQLIALPLKISKGDGAPARVIAIEN